MSDTYGFLAPIYQPLARAVFGKDLIEANAAFSGLAYGKKSLIIGGGDGEAYQTWDENYVGEYWDTSLKMAELAKKSLSKSKLQVHCGRWTREGRFDVVFLPFVLDTMLDEDITKVLAQIRSALESGGQVVLSDFFPPRTFLQSIIQQIMITGFRVFAAHSRKNLPDFERFFNPKSWTKVEEKIWRKGWIRAQVYVPVAELVK